MGANYGPSLVATSEATKNGYSQILWLYGDEGYCTEAGTSNFFVVWKNKKTGRTELVTAPLDDKLILDGVTRASVIELAKERLSDELDVVERKHTILDLIEAGNEGRLVECFVAGTAVCGFQPPSAASELEADVTRSNKLLQFFICPVSLIHHRGRDVTFGMGTEKPDGSYPGGKYTNLVKGWLVDIMYGNVEHPWGIVIEEEKEEMTSVAGFPH